MSSSERPGPGEPENSKTVTFTQKDLRDAARLFKLLVDPAGLGAGFPPGMPAAPSSGNDTADRQALLARARAQIDERRARKRYFHRDIFGEPAWEILLTLYVTEQSGTRLTTSRLAEWIEAPLTTVLRWVKALEEQSLVGRADHPTDRRIIFISLLEPGRTALDNYFRAIAS